MAYSKEEAYRLYRDGIMPEFWYRQKYATFEESYLEDLRQSERNNRNLVEEYQLK